MRLDLNTCKSLINKSPFAFSPKLGKFKSINLCLNSNVHAMASINFTLNGKSQTIDVDPQMPLLWAIRDVVGLTGTKFGCGVAQCGACTLHLEGKAIRSCITPVSNVAGKAVTTIEGISSNRSHPIQKAWIQHQVPQCGYCQSGQIMSAVALLEKNPSPTDEQIDTGMSGNICRCGTYQRIHDAIKTAAKEIESTR